MRIWVTGGSFDRSGECFIDEVDLAAGIRRRLLTFTPPSELQVPSKGFTGARWLDSRTLLVASFCAVWRFDVGSWACTGVLHQTDFNDLHDVHVDHAEGRLFVCNTGLDAVEVFDIEGRFVGRHSMSPSWFDGRRQEGWAVKRSQFPALTNVGWERNSPPPLVLPVGDHYAGSSRERAFHQRATRDYCHPNHVVTVNGQLAVTLLAAREVRCLRTFRTLASFEGHPHDAHCFGGLVWTTSTGGLVQAWDRSGPVWRVVETYDTAKTGHIGWCRGILVSEQGVAVALTRMHESSQYRWRDDPVERTETAVLWLERGSGRLLSHVDFAEPRQSKLFAILPPRCPIDVA